MANLFFPQLSSGAVAQYPIQKTRLVRTIKNVLPSGDLLLLPDPSANMLVWRLAYKGLSAPDLASLKSFFTACVGPFHSFTYLDPTDNLLSSSSNFAALNWNISGSITVAGDVPDPAGGTSAFTITNTGQASGQITQMLLVPAAYQYCFSLYAISNQPSQVTLLRQGPTSQAIKACPVGTQWTRIVSEGALNESGTTFTVGIQLVAGQQITVYGLQLEAQVAPSLYRPTQNGGVYTNAHWGTEQLSFTAQAPNLFATAFNIETAI